MPLRVQLLIEHKGASQECEGYFDGKDFSITDKNIQGVIVKWRPE